MTKTTLKTILGVLVAVVVLGCMGHIDTHYTRKNCEVIKVEQGLMTIKDTCGYEWCYYSNEEVYTVGTKVDLKMYTNNTDTNIEDDEIVKIVVVAQD